MAKKEIKSKYTDVPVKDIKNGVIVLDNKKMVAGVKIVPRNLFILDPATQNAVINNLKVVYNVIDYEFWIIAADRPVDINVYLSELQVAYHNSNDPVKRKMILEDIDKANMFMNNNVVDTEYYLLFKDKDMDAIQKKIRNLISNLASAGLTSFQATNEDLRMILDNFLNGGETTTFGTVMS